MHSWTSRLNSIGSMVMYCMLGLVLMNFITGYIKDHDVDVTLDMIEINQL